MASPDLLVRSPPSKLSRFNSRQDDRTYLPHLDGLRAIALVGVLLFHFEVPPFTGGFAGVDIFLSLSGFLITRNIVHQITDDSFSLRSFYYRRFFRLYPAAVFTTFVTLLLSFYVFPNGAALQTAESALSSLLFSSNIYFHLQSGYFDTTALLKPLLHTWSLSLEEQFYFLWAPLIYGIALIPNMRRNLLIVLSLIISFSLLSSGIVAELYPSFAFFELPSRLFQFAMGAVLAVARVPLSADMSKRSFFVSSYPIVQNFLVSSAFFGIFACFILTPKQATPVQMIPTTICTLLLISFPDAFISRKVLSMKLIRTVGHISYSAYLVHWPLYVFVRFVLQGSGYGAPNFIMMTVLTLALASKMRGSVEERYRHCGRNARLSFFAVLLMTFALAGLGVLSKGFRMRGPSEKMQITEAFRRLGFPDGRLEVCQDQKPLLNYLGKFDFLAGQSRSHSRICNVGAPRATSKEAMVIYGNSFIGHWLFALHIIGMRHNLHFRVFLAPSCPLFARKLVDRVPDKGILHCKRVHETFWAQVDSMERNSTLMLSFLWGFLSENAIRYHLKPIFADLREKGIKIVYNAEPPGMDVTRHKTFFDCVSLIQTPLGKMLHSRDLGKIRKTCGDRERGFYPFTRRVKLMEWYNTVFAEEGFNDVKFVNVFHRVCKKEQLTNDTRKESFGDHRRNDEYRCKIPRSREVGLQVNDPGYKRDGIHISDYGSFAMTQILEDELVEKADLLSKDVKTMDHNGTNGLNKSAIHVPYATT